MIGGGRAPVATDVDAGDGRSTAEPDIRPGRLGAMHDPRPAARSAAAFALPVILAAVLVAACSGPAATSSPTPAPSAPATPVATDPPPTDDGGSGGILPPDGARVVVPRPGQRDVHPVSIETLSATVDGRGVVVAADWWSGVEPCSILDSVVVAQDGTSFGITLREGRGPEDVACIAIAELHRTFIDLGELDPGTYTITDATDGMPVIEVVVG